VQLNNSSLAEALTHGLPVVTTRGTAPERPFVDGKNMLMCQPKNPAAMMQAMKRVLTDADLRRTLAEGSTSWRANGFPGTGLLIEPSCLGRKSGHRQRPD